ncbi:MAG: extracellular solute-binding protein [Oscillospiraceae bacterium]|jgi:putative aldouronate transport system substrate-binding protein|nr:extracellular solute-binding protein [Oscillospiraceae bacterium]
MNAKNTGRKKNASGKRKPVGKTKLKLIIVLGALVVVLIAGVLLYLGFQTPADEAAEPATNLKIASRTDVIAYFDARGVTDYLENKLNFTIEWVDYGVENVYDRLLEDIGKAPTDLPDAYLGLGLSEIDFRTIAPDVFQNLNNLQATGTTFLKQAINEDTSRLTEMQTDGQLYSFPSLYESYAEEYPQKIWINAQWMLQLGLPIPSTTEEFYNVLRLFKETDMNGNGADDEIPLGVAYSGVSHAGFGFLVNAFVTSDYDLSESQGYLNVSDGGEVYTAVTTPQFKDALKYIQRLFAEGLVDANAFTLGAETFLNGSTNSERFGVIAAQDLNAVFNNTERAAAYIPLAPLDGGNRATLVRRTSVKTGGYMVSLNTARLKEAVRLGDAMMDMEGTLTILYGAEGAGWEYADSRVAAMGGTETMWRALGAPELAMPATIPFWMSAAVVLSQEAGADENGEVSLQTAANWQGYLNYVTREVYEPVGRPVIKNVLPELTLTSSQQQELDASGNVRAQIYSYLTETCRRLVTTDADIDAEFPGFVQTLQNTGLTKLLTLLQDALERQTR